MSHSHYAPAAGVSARRFGDDVVVLDVARGVYFSINAVGTHIWEALISGTSLDDVPESLVARFAVDVDTARRDSVAFVAALLKERLIEPTKSGATDG